MVQIAGGTEAWQQRDRVDLIVMPVRIAGAWLLYLTQRTGHLQTVVRIAERFANGTDIDTTEALLQIDTQMHTLGRGAMAIWLRMLMRDITGLGAAAQEARRRTESDIEQNLYTTM